MVGIIKRHRELLGLTFITKKDIFPGGFVCFLFVSSRRLVLFLPSVRFFSFLTALESYGEIMKNTQTSRLRQVGGYMGDLFFFFIFQLASGGIFLVSESNRRATRLGDEGRRIFTEEGGSRHFGTYPLRFPLGSWLEDLFDQQFFFLKEKKKEIKQTSLENVWVIYELLNGCAQHTKLFFLHQKRWFSYIYFSLFFFGWILNRWTPLFINLKKKEISLSGWAGLISCRWVIWDNLFISILPYAAMCSREGMTSIRGGYSLWGCRLISTHTKKKPGLAAGPLPIFCGLYLPSYIFFGGPSVGARPYSWWKTIKSIENQLPSNSENEKKPLKLLIPPPSCIYVLAVVVDDGIEFFRWTVGWFMSICLGSRGPCGEFYDVGGGERKGAVRKIIEKSLFVYLLATNRTGYNIETSSN